MKDINLNIKQYRSGLMLHLYWRESESDVAWNGLLLFDAVYLHCSESEIASDVSLSLKLHH